MRVLILADECNPEWPSLPVVGYKAAVAISQYADVVVATHVRNRENIEKHGIGRATVRYVDNEYINRPIFKIGCWLRGGNSTGWNTAVVLHYPCYLAFEWEVWKAFKRELRAGEFDVIHRLTPMSPALPSLLARLSRVPFVLGPLNGGLKWPKQFHSELRREGEWLTYIREFYRALPYVSSTYSQSSAILAAFEHTAKDLPTSVQNKIVQFPEVGLDPEVFAQRQTRPVRKSKTILFAGRFVPYKLPGVVVKAFASRPDLHQEHRLIMVGDGPERKELETFVRERGLQDRVQFLGWRTQAEVGDLMREADIFAFPSIRELGAGVVVEAMACGLACVVVDYGGPAGLVKPGCGIKIPLGDREAMTRAFGQALHELVRNERTTLELGAAAREEAMCNYTWDVKAKRTTQVYDWVLGRSPRPEF